MKKILIIGLLFLTGCSSVNANTDNITTTTEDLTTVTYSQRIYYEFAELMINNPDNQLNQDYDSYYLYFYGPYCGVCNSIKNEVLSKIELLKNDKIFLVETSKLEDVNPNINVTSTPSLVLVENGQVQEIYVGSAAVLDVINTLN